jgi:hypothetical protein
MMIAMGCYATGVLTVEVWFRWPFPTGWQGRPVVADLASGTWPRRLPFVRQFFQTFTGAWAAMARTTIQGHGAAEAVTAAIPIPGGADKLFARLKVVAP